MAYYVVRLYSGSSEQPAEELLKRVVAKELAPKLREAGGLIRYITGIADDGRIVSASTYQDKEAAQRGTLVARELVARTNALRGYQLTQTLEGEVAALLNGDAEYEPAFGMARLFSTGATAEKVVETIRKARASAQDEGASRGPQCHCSVAGWPGRIIRRLRLEGSSRTAFGCHKKASGGP